MRKVALLAIGLASLAIVLVTRGQAPSSPALRLVPLNPAMAVAEADSVVLASAISTRDTGHVAESRQSEIGTQQLVETETTLDVHRVLKGQPIGDEVKFRFYDGRGYVQIGPRQGPSAGDGKPAVFFLKRQPDGSFRALVDGYRPDIETPWINDPKTATECDSPSRCVSEMVLSYRQGDDPQAFVARLDGNMVVSLHLIGFVATVDLLNRLAKDAASGEVRRAACVELGESFPLELPRLCVSLFSDSEAVASAGKRAAGIRSRFKEEGLTAVKQRLGSNTEADLRAYVDLLSSTGDSEARAIAAEIARHLQ